MAYSDKKITEIFEFFNKNGEVQTLKKYNIKPVTLNWALRLYKSKNQIKYDFEKIESKNEIIVSLRSHEIKTIDEIVEYSKIDTSIWEPYKMITNPWGSETNACFQIKVWWQRIAGTEINVDQLCDNIINRIEKYSPPAIIKRKPAKDAFLWEVGIVDHHLGQFSWGKEVGFKYDVKEAETIYNNAIDFLIDKIKPYNVGKILYHFGQDFYNVNSQFNQTVAGTPQDEDGRWQRSFDKGVMVHINAINKLKQIADVDAIQIKGNHDEERIQYAGSVVKAWFRNDKNINIDNRPISRKYYRYGKNLIGFSHAETISMDRLLGLMPIEAKEDWSKCEHYSWHLGHLHHNVIRKNLEDQNGIRIIHLPALTPVAVWHFKKGYLHNRETQSFLHHPEKGNMIQINYRI